MDQGFVLWQGYPASTNPPPKGMRFRKKKGLQMDSPTNPLGPETNVPPSLESLPEFEDNGPVEVVNLPPAPNNLLDKVSLVEINDEYRKLMSREMHEQYPSLVPAFKHPVFIGLGAPSIFHHAEAYKRMNYRCQICGKNQLVWNSRDGVSPFNIGCLAPTCEGMMNHVDWEKDTLDLNWVPSLGEPAFVDRNARDTQAYYIHQWMTNPKFRVYFLETWLKGSDRNLRPSQAKRLRRPSVIQFEFKRFLEKKINEIQKGEPALVAWDATHALEFLRRTLLISGMIIQNSDNRMKSASNPRAPRGMKKV